MKGDTAKGALWYIVGELSNKAIPFLLLPVLTLFLSPAEFGVVSTYQALLQLFVIIISLSLHGALSVLFFKVPRTAFRRILSAIFIITLFAMSISVILVLLINPQLITFLKLDFFWVITLPVTALLLSFIQFFLVYNQVRKRYKGYVVFQLFNTVVNMGVSISLIGYWEIGLEGRLIGILVAALCGGLWSAIKFYSTKSFSVPDVSSYKVPLRFSLPLVPHALSNWVKSYADRLILMSLFGAVSVGEYAVTYQICTILSVIFMATNKAIMPSLYSAMSKGAESDSQLKVVLVRLSIVIVLMTILFATIVPIIFPYIVEDSYSIDIATSTLLCIGFMFQGFYLLIINFFMFHEKTKTIALFALANTIVYIVIAIPLVSMFEGIGAAAASMLSWGGLFFSLLIYGQRASLLPWAFR